MNSKSKEWPAASLVSTWLCAACLWSSLGCNRAQPPVPSTPLASPAARAVKYVAQPFELPTIEQPGYVGFQQCAECHAERVAECLPTSHFQTCRPPTLERMPAAFASDRQDEHELRLPGADVTFEMATKDERFLQTAIRQATNQRVNSSIDLVYGAKDVSDEVYLSWRADGSMWELPVAWIHATGSWGAAGFDRVQGTNFSRELTLRCFECHNTWFEHVPGTTNVYRRENFLIGVTCERCHGPGKEHVDYHHQHPDEQTPRHILYPGSLPRDRLIEVCTQCHSNAIRHRGPALAFRPGERLEDYYRFVTPKYDEDDHVADQITDLRQSSCFQESEMTCITCHDPHLTDQPSGGMTLQETCTQCHQTAACGKRAELPAAVADECVACHMRQYSKINVNFDLAEDSYVPPLQRSQHRIAVDTVGTTETLYRWYLTQADDESAAAKAEQSKQWLVDHWLSEGQQLQRVGRFTAAVAAMREILRFDPEHEQARARVRDYAEQQRAFDDLMSRAKHAMSDSQDQQAVDLFQQVLQIQPESATAYGRLGTLYAKLGQTETAIEHLSKVVELDEDDQYGLSMLGWLSLLAGDFTKAADYYRKADEIEPFSSKLNFLWGTSLLQAGRLIEAKERFSVAVQSDPRNLDAQRSLAVTCLQLEQWEAAGTAAEYAARLTGHQSLVDLMVLAEAHRGLGELDIVQDIVGMALSASKNDQQSTAEIKKWCADNRIPLP